MSPLLIANLLLCACMTGLIWFVQVVHYPLLASVGQQEAVAYEQLHVTRTGWVVAPLMLAELVVAAALPFVAGPDAAWSPLAFASLALLAAIWLSTALLQVPCHRELSLRWSADVVRRLVRTNWIRTASWSLRSLLACAMLWMNGHSA